MRPSQPNQHLRQRTVVSSHAKTVEEGRALHRIAKQERTHDGMGLVDDTLGQRMVIVTDRANLSVREKEFLSLEGVSPAYDSAIDGDKIFVVDARLRRARQPARQRPAKEHHVLVLARSSEALIEFRHRGFVFGTIGFDDNGHEWRCGRCPYFVILSEAKDLCIPALQANA